MSPQAATLLVFLMEMMSSFISVLVGYYASKAYRTSSAKGFLFLYMGFLLLGLGIFLRTVTATYLIIVNRVTETDPSPLFSLSNVAGNEDPASLIDKNSVWRAQKKSSRSI